MSTEKVSRRKFFSTVMMGGAAAAVAAVTAPTLGGRKTELVQGEPRKPEGYRETAHIKNYYRSTLV